MHEKIIYKEYACYDYSLNETETQANIANAFKLGITNISVLPYSVPTARSAVPSPDNISISVPIDYPYGISDIKSRNFSVSQAAKQKIQKIDLFVPSKVLSNRKYDKFREDIRSNLDICLENNIELRYILEYRVFSHEVLAKICNILIGLGINTIIPASGHMIDDLNDNLIACNYLNTKSKIQTICNGNIYHRKHVENFKNSNTYGIRFHYINSINLFNN
jgi:deoxyribose-phosphate aldolase